MLSHGIYHQKLNNLSKTTFSITIGKIEKMKMEGLSYSILKLASHPEFIRKDKFKSIIHFIFWWRKVCRFKIKLKFHDLSRVLWKLIIMGFNNTRTVHTYQPLPIILNIQEHLSTIYAKLKENWKLKTYKLRRFLSSSKHEEFWVSCRR